MDEALALFRANVLFRNFEVQGHGDRVLIYLTLLIHQVRPDWCGRCFPLLNLICVTARTSLNVFYVALVLHTHQLLPLFVGPGSINLLLFLL